MAEKKQEQDLLHAEEAISGAEAFIQNNKSKIIGVIVALVVIVGGFFAYKHFIAHPAELKASNAIFKGEEYFRNDNYETALKGDSTGFIGFVKAADEYSGTDAGNLANAYAGLCYAQLGQFDNAIKYLEAFKGDDALVAPAVLATLGNCYAQKNQLDKAVADLLKAADKANSTSLSPTYLIQAGEILEKQGKKTEAVEAYQKVKDKYGNSYQAMEIDKYIERASN